MNHPTATDAVAGSGSERRTMIGSRLISVGLPTYERLVAVAHARSVPVSILVEEIPAPRIGRDDGRRDRRLRAWSRPTMTVEGASLRAWRLSRGWSQIDLATRLGVTGSTVSRCEIGRRRPAGKLAAALVSLGWERPPAPDRYGPAPAQPASRADREAFGRALAAWRFGSGRTQEQLAGEIRAAASKICRVEQGRGALNDPQLAALSRLGFGPPADGVQHAEVQHG